jgi:integrase
MKNLLQYRNSKNWYFRFYDDQGRRRTVSLGTDDEAKAINKARLVQAGEALRRVENIQVQTPLDKLVDTYLVEARARRRKPMRPETAKTVGLVLKKFIREAEITAARGFVASAVERWLAKLNTEGKSQETLRSYTRDIKTFGKWLSGRGLCGALVIDLPDRKAKIRKPWLRKAEVARVIKAVEPKVGPHSKPEGQAQARQTADELRFILYCGFHAGLRRKEIGVARVSWFDLKTGLLHVSNDQEFTSKDTENRTVPLTDEFRDFLKVFLRNRKPEEFCLKPDHLAGRAKYRYDFQRLVLSHFKRCSVNLDIHGMRRSFASNLVSEGESIFIVAQWLGDGVQVVQKHYAYLAPHSGSINRLVA